jgi:hypothetical protein
MTMVYIRDCDERSLLDETYGIKATPCGICTGHVNPQKALI